MPAFMVTPALDTDLFWRRGGSCREWKGVLQNKYTRATCSNESGRTDFVVRTGRGFKFLLLAPRASEVDIPPYHSQERWP